jgi:hypothetical protein
VTSITTDIFYTGSNRRKSGALGQGYVLKMKAPWTDPSLRELVALAALAAFGGLLRWRGVTSYSSLSLRAPAPWRLPRWYDVRAEMIECADRPLYA